MKTQVIVALLVGLAVGAASASVLYPKAAPVVVAQATTGAAWTAEHSAIPTPEAKEEPAPTF